jgi:hypothetical protein
VGPGPVGPGPSFSSEGDLMTGTSRTTKTAGPGEILVSVGGELIPYRNRQAEFDAFLRRAGRPAGAWSANSIAGTTLARTQGAEAVELWAWPNCKRGEHVLLVRFTLKTSGTVPFAEVVGAARAGTPATKETVKAAGRPNGDSGDR